jgi:hypothetical protein
VKRRAFGRNASPFPGNAQGDEVYRLFQKTALLIVTIVYGVPFSAAEGACAHRIPTTENRAEDAKAFCVTNQDPGKAVDAAINACGGHADKEHDREQKCFVDSLWVREGGGKWRTSGGSDSFPNSTCGALAVAPAQTRPPQILFFASSGNTIAEASANAIGACDQENPSFTPHLKCSVIAAKACDTLALSQGKTVGK